jgi:hypothetical protein
MTRRELMTTVARAGLIAALSDFSNAFEGGTVMAQETEKGSSSTLQLRPPTRAKIKLSRFRSTRPN